MARPISSSGNEVAMQMAEDRMVIDAVKTTLHARGDLSGLRLIQENEAQAECAGTEVEK
jgi:hypothetical protein